VQPAENLRLTFWVRERRLYFYHYIWTFSKKRGVNAESYIIVFSQSVYRLRSPDMSVLSVNTNKSHSAKTVLQQNSQNSPQEEKNPWTVQVACNNVVWPVKHTFYFILMYNSGNMFRLAIE
jgi:hypothetical protein